MEQEIVVTVVLTKRAGDRFVGGVMTGSEAVVNGPVSGLRKLRQVGWHGCSRYRARISDSYFIPHP